MNRTEVAALFLGAAALGGFVAASRRYREKPIPLWLALGHGALALVGLALLCSFVGDLVSVAGSRAILGFVPVALGLLLAAAAGGFVLLSFHARRKPIPIGLMATHAVIALVGYGSLLLGILTGK